MLSRRDAFRKTLEARGLDDATIERMISDAEGQSAVFVALADIVDEPVPAVPAVYVHETAVEWDLTEEMLGDARLDVGRLDADAASLSLSVPDPHTPDAEEGLTLATVALSPVQGRAISLALARASGDEPTGDRSVVRVDATTAEMPMSDEDRARMVLEAYRLAHVLER